MNATMTYSLIMTAISFVFVILAAGCIIYERRSYKEAAAKWSETNRDESEKKKAKKEEQKRAAQVAGIQAPTSPAPIAIG